MILNRRTNLLLGLAGLLFTAGLVRGADFAGKFTLPREVRWGTAVLPAGDYTLSVNNNTTYGLVTIRQGTKHIAMVMPQGADTTGLEGGSSLQIVGARVKSLHLAPAGMTYTYAVPKNEQRRLEVRGMHPPGITVAVAAK
ncbi:MAG TPA: hypothetical protein VH477_07230 [Bryobacteraceae bacterium]